MSTKYTYEYCRALAEKCSSLKEFREKHNSAFVTIHHNKKDEWLDSFSKEFNWIDHKKSKYTHEYCKQLACKYSSRNDFKHKEPSAYTVSLRKGWIAEFFPSIKHRTLNKETCRIIAAKYSSRSELKKGDPVAYRKICESKWMDILPTSKVTKCNLDYEACLKIASKFKKRTEMREQYPTEYNHCMRNGWLDDFFPKVVWRESSYTYDICRNIASKSNSIADFKRRNGKAYEKSRKNGWIMDFVKEFKFLSTGDAIRKSRGFMTVKEITSIAKKYKTLREFRIKEPNIYVNAIARKLIGKFTWLKRVPLEERWREDYVYAYEFKKNKVAYIGRTGNVQRRHNEHSSDTDKICQYAISIGETIPEPIILHHGLKLKEGQKLECQEIERYKENGWTLLNSMKGGGIGGLANTLSKSTVMREAKKYEYLKDLVNNNVRIYHILLRYGWLNECTWLKRLAVPPGHWDNYDNCLAEARKYSSRGEFQNKSGGACDAARRHHWLDKWKWLAPKKSNRSKRK